jgi:hypothetical protein
MNLNKFSKHKIRNTKIKKMRDGMIHLQKLLKERKYLKLKPTKIEKRNY